MLKRRGGGSALTSRCAVNATTDESTPPLNVAAIGAGLLTRAATLCTSNSRQRWAYSVVRLVEHAPPRLGRPVAMLGNPVGFDDDHVRGWDTRDPGVECFRSVGDGAREVLRDSAWVRLPRTVGSASRCGRSVPQMTRRDVRVKCSGRIPMWSRARIARRRVGLHATKAKSPSSFAGASTSHRATAPRARGACRRTRGRRRGSRSGPRDCRDVRRTRRPASHRAARPAHPSHRTSPSAVAQAPRRLHATRECRPGIEGNGGTEGPEEVAIHTVAGILEHGDEPTHQRAVQIVEYPGDFRVVARGHRH